ncbi:hypothetical protein [Nitratifractor sp.]
MTKSIILILFLFLGLTACESEGRNPKTDSTNLSHRHFEEQSTPYLMKSSSLSTQKDKEENQSLKRKHSPKETELMHAMGIEIKEGEIILDTKKSKHFFKKLTQEIKSSMHRSMEKVEQHTPKAEDLGIHVQKDKVTIDLNRTRSFMKEWVNTMKVLGDELDRSLAPKQP